MHKTVSKKYIFYILFSLLPLAFTYAFYNIYAQASLFEVIPYAHFDPFDYFLQINGFAAHGFAMGHFSQNEVVPFVAKSPFGVHGPVYVSILGLIARIFNGFAVNAAPVVNFIFVTSCILAFYLIVRPGLLAAAYVAVLLVTYPDFIKYSATFWQEPINIGLAFVASALFFKVLTAIKHQKAHSLALFICLIVSSLIRPTWAFYLPGFFIATSNYSRRAVLRGMVLGCICLVLVFFTYQFFASPWVGHYAPWQLVLIDVYGKSISLSAALVKLSLTLYGKLENIFSVLSHDYFLLLAFLFSLLAVGNTLYRATMNNNELRHSMLMKLAWVLSGYCFLLVATLFTQFLQPRHIYPGFLFCCLLLAAFRMLPLVRTVLLGAQVMTFIFSFQGMQDTAYDLTQNLHGRQERIEWFSRYAGNLIRFEQTSNSWCNSLLVDDFSTVTEFLGLPAGIGLSYVLHPKSFSGFVKSRYVIVKSDSAASNFIKKNNLFYVTGTTLGDLYINLDCHCPEKTSPEQSDLSMVSSLGQRVAGVYVDEHKMVKVEDLQHSDYIDSVSSSVKTIYPGEKMILLRLNLDIKKFFHAQVNANMSSHDNSSCQSPCYDKVSLDLVFIQKQNQIIVVSKSMYVHCYSGRFNNYKLSDDDIANISRGGMVSNVFWTHNDTYMPICQEP